VDAVADGVPVLVADTAEGVAVAVMLAVPALERVPEADMVAETLALLLALLLGVTVPLRLAGMPLALGEAVAATEREGEAAAAAMEEEAVGVGREDMATPAGEGLGLIRRQSRVTRARYPLLLPLSTLVPK